MKSHHAVARIPRTRTHLVAAGSFYAAVLGDVLYAVGVAMLLLHDESAAHIELRRRVAALRRRRRLGDAAINDAVAAGSSAYKALSELKFLQRQLGVEDDAVQVCTKPSKSQERCPGVYHVVQVPIAVIEVLERRPGLWSAFHRPSVLRQCTRVKANIVVEESRDK